MPTHSIEYHISYNVLQGKLWLLFGSVKLKLKTFGLNLLVRLIFFGYTLLMLSPALPVIKDAIAHTFYNSYHVAVVHSHNGVNHVHYEQKKLVEDLKSSKAPSKQKIETQDFYADCAENHMDCQGHFALGIQPCNQLYNADQELTTYSAQALRPPCC